ncbi:hypothetical protein AAG570_008281 [Ranatra chinensis]|uniref:CAAX prenyl protease 2 n=1 Tax=Ranatra chinensis TaxID=642074 RepID=A0ABD0YEG9_9HEMI
MVLFLGPIAMQFQSDFLDLYSEPKYWISNFRNLIWLRNYIIAPFSEELTFRACMLPLLIQCFRPQAAIFICPLFFGIAHLHHIIGCIKEGMNVKTALLVSGFQFTYTTIFGAYSAFLFLRTGHFVASLFAHTFCNYMGFPQFVELYGYSEPKRTIIVVLCLVGFVLWCVLLSPLTTPSWYKNHLFWKVYS